MGSRERVAATNATKAARRRQWDAQRDVGQVAQAEHDNGVWGQSALNAA